MAHVPSVSDWEKYEDIINAGLRGWNAHMKLPEILSQEFVWLKEFNFGFFTESDLPKVLSLGWQHLEREHFDFENFNKAIGLRFGLRDDAAGHIMYLNDYVMIMPKDFREKLERRRNEESERLYEAKIYGQKYVAPGDAGGSAEVHLEQEQISVGEMRQGRKAGRPPNKK